MLSKPYFILWLGMLVFVLIGLFSKSKDAIDIQLHDTYFVIAYFQLWAGFASFLGLLGLIYWLMDWLGLKLWVALSFLHIFGTYLSFLGFIYFFLRMIDYPRRYYSFSNSYSISQILDNLSSIIITIFLLSQILFLINIMIGVFRKYL